MFPRSASLPARLSSMRFPSVSRSRDIPFYDPIEPDGASRPAWRHRDVAKYVLLAVVGGVAMVLVCASAFENALVSGLDVHRSFQKATGDGIVDLAALPAMRPYRQDAHCKQDGSICLCSDDYTPIGVDGNGFNTFQKQQLHTACQQWTFKVGDVLLVERPAEMKQAYIPAYVVSTVSNSPVVHTAIVTKVPPPGINQTADNIIVTEALKGDVKQVTQNTFRQIVERFPFGGIAIRRVDAKRFPTFFSAKRQNEMTQWGDARVGDGFDSDMLIPIKRRFAAKERYIAINPDCKERNRALAMFRKGGPGKYICSEFVGWTLAFAGGINTDYGLLSNDCEAPSWTVQNIQPLPGQITDMDFFDQKLLYHMPCSVNGCFVGVPKTPDWTGGTMTTTTTTTTSTTTSTTSTTTTSTSTTSTSITTTSSSSTNSSVSFPVVHRK